MKALGKELSFVPSLDGQGIVAIGYRSSRLTKEEMANLIELIYSEGAKRGVAFTGKPHELGPIQRCGHRQGGQGQTKSLRRSGVAAIRAAQGGRVGSPRFWRGRGKAEQHKWDAETLKRVAEAIEKRG